MVGYPTLPLITKSISRTTCRTGLKFSVAIFWYEKHMKLFFVLQKPPHNALFQKWPSKKWLTFKVDNNFIWFTFFDIYLKYNTLHFFVPNLKSKMVFCIFYMVFYKTVVYILSLFRFHNWTITIWHRFVGNAFVLPHCQYC